MLSRYFKKKYITDLKEGSKGPFFYAKLFKLYDNILPFNKKVEKKFSKTFLIPYF